MHRSRRCKSKSPYKKPLSRLRKPRRRKRSRKQRRHKWPWSAQGKARRRLWRKNPILVPASSTWSSGIPKASAYNAASERLSPLNTSTTTSRPARNNLSAEITSVYSRLSQGSCLMTKRRRWRSISRIPNRRSYKSKMRAESCGMKTQSDPVQHVHRFINLMVELKC